MSLLFFQQFSDPIHIGEQAFWVRAIPCWAGAQQRHKSHCQLEQGGILLPSVARRFGAEKSWHAYRAAPSQQRGTKKVDSTELS